MDLLKPPPIARSVQAPSNTSGEGAGEGFGNKPWVLIRVLNIMDPNILGLGAFIRVLSMNPTIEVLALAGGSRALHAFCLKRGCGSASAPDYYSLVLCFTLLLRNA